jgi:hypothetical protein
MKGMRARITRDLGIGISIGKVYHFGEVGTGWRSQWPKREEVGDPMAWKKLA